MSFREDRFGTVTHAGEGCILRLTSFGVPAAYISSLAGWHTFLDAIAPSIAGVAVIWTMEAEREMMAVYEAREPWLKGFGSGGTHEAREP